MYYEVIFLAIFDLVFYNTFSISLALIIASAFLIVLFKK